MLEPSPFETDATSCASVVSAASCISLLSEDPELSECKQLLAVDSSTSPSELELFIRRSLAAPATFRETKSVLVLQDALYRRFMQRYSQRPDFPPQLVSRTIGRQEMELFQSISTGDVTGIRRFMGRFGLNWNFVYPPAKLSRNTKGQLIRKVDGWCRSPLGLLVNPDDGTFERVLPGVPEEERLALIRDALRGGADPNFPPFYWATPAVLACFSGDVQALQLLAEAGCNLTQKVEFAVQQKPLWTLAHAAAWSGNLNILQFLEKHVPASLFSMPDSDGSNPLHTMLEHSRKLEVGRFLLSHGCDGFAFNHMQRSPLSMAIESMPEFAKELMEDNSRLERQWWGNDLYRFRFESVVLPLTGRRTPVQARDSAGELHSIEEMIVKYKAKDLMSTPLIQDLLKLQWRFFGRRQFAKQVIPYCLYVVAVFVICTVDPQSTTFKLAVAVFLFLWFNEIYGIFARLSQCSFWLFLDMWNAAVATTVTVFQVLVAAQYREAELQRLMPYFAPFVGTLQVTLIFRIMRIVAMDRTVGPLLIAVLQMLTDTLPWLVLMLLTVFGFANGIYALVNFNNLIEDLEDAEFDFSYGNILWILFEAATFDQEDFKDMPKGLSGGMFIGACVLFWGFISVTVLILLNLLIALYNTTYVTVCEGHSMQEWFFLRFELMVEYETDPDLVGLQEYYLHLERFDSKRAVGDLQSTE